MKINVYQSRLLLQIILLCLVKPAYFEYIQFTDNLYFILGILCVLFVLILIYIENIMTEDLLWIILFYGYILFSTFINNPANIVPYLKSNVLSFSMCIVFFLWMKNNPKLLIDAFGILELYVYINLITILLHPNGLYSSTLYTENWFLGYKNPQIRTILPILSISIINSYIKYKKISIRVYLLYAASAATFLLIDSATSLVGMTVFTLALFLFQKNYIKIPGFINLVSVNLITIFLDYLLIFGHIINIFADLIMNVLHRSLTLTHRTTLWDIAIKYIQESIIFGHGFMTGNEFVFLYGRETFTHPHNFFLYLLTMGGIILFCIYMYGIMIANKHIVKYLNHFCCKVNFFCLISFLIMGLGESLVTTVLLYPMLILAMNIEKICE